MIIKREERASYDAKILNAMYAEGYRYFCKANYRELDYDDPWSGMPVVAWDTFFATTAEELEQIAAQAKYPFSGECETVHELAEHYETKEELQVDYERREAERKAKKLATEQRKADEAGLTLEAYRKEKARKATIRRLQREIAELENELARKKAVLAEKMRED